tara:strand:+ start:258 stop:536 length:279 start_codon:yes stop_codon:yes gene_type:complete
MGNSVALSKANFEYVKRNLTGTSNAGYVLFIGGFEKDALVNEAKENLISSLGRPLKNNEVLINLTVDWKKTFFLIFMENKCTITADIVVFTE